MDIDMDTDRFHVADQDSIQFRKVIKILDNKK